LIHSRLALTCTKVITGNLNRISFTGFIIVQESPRFAGEKGEGERFYNNFGVASLKWFSCNRCKEKYMSSEELETHHQIWCKKLHEYPGLNDSVRNTNTSTSANSSGGMHLWKALQVWKILSSSSLTSIMFSVPHPERYSVKGFTCYALCSTSLRLLSLTRIAATSTFSCMCLTALCLCSRQEFSLGPKWEHRPRLLHRCLQSSQRESEDRTVRVSLAKAAGRSSFRGTAPGITANLSAGKNLSASVHIVTTKQNSKEI